MGELLFGMSLGLTAGISPGPLLTLVVTASLRHGLGAGTRVAMAPLVTDIPIILIGLLVIEALPSIWLAALSLIGAGFVAYLGVETVLAARRATLEPGERSGSSRRDISQGAMVNLLNPHPWLFWLSVGGPRLHDAWHREPIDGVWFLAGFYLLLVGSKIAIAVAIGTGRHWLTLSWYRRVLGACGLFLLGLAVVLAAHVVRARL